MNCRKGKRNWERKVPRGIFKSGFIVDFGWGGLRRLILDETRLAPLGDADFADYADYYGFFEWPDGHFYGFKWILFLTRMHMRLFE